MHPGETVQGRYGAAVTAHEYTSTACLHDQCGSCRNTCKFCDAPCRHPCHPASGETPVPWVDQARDIARELLRDGLHNGPIDPALLRRIEADPALFWLRGEVVPDGTWRPA